METEYAARRKLLVLLFATTGKISAAQKAVLIEKVIRGKVETIADVIDDMEQFFPFTALELKDAYVEELLETSQKLHQRPGRLISGKGQLELILDSLNGLYHQRSPHDKDDSLENACHYIYRTLNDYLQFSTRDARIWHTHPLGNEWVSDDKLTILYTIMSLPNHEYGDDIKLALMSVALQPEVVNFNGFMVPCSVLVKPTDLKNWMFRTQQLVPISEIKTGRNIRCIARQDKLVRMAQYLMSIGTTYRENAEEIIDSLINRINPTGPELKVWVAEVNKLRKNQKKVPAKANLIRLDLVWLLANLTDPENPRDGLTWMTDAWHHNADNEEAFLSGRFMKATLKAKLSKMRAQINAHNDPAYRTDENKLAILINVLKGLFENEKVLNDRSFRLQLIQLRNHLPYYLGLCDNYVAEWNAKLPTSIGIPTEKETPMSEISYPLRRRMVSTVLSTVHPSTACAELLAAMANNAMNTPVEVGTYVSTYMKGSADLLHGLSVKHDSIDDIKDDDQQTILRLMTEIHNLGHMPGMDGNSYHAKFLAIYEGYLGISQRIHDAFYNPKKESTVKTVNAYLPLLDALADPRFNATFAATGLLGLMNRICDIHPIDKINLEDELTKFGCSFDIIKKYTAKLAGTMVEAQEPGYRAKALRSIAYYLNSLPKGIVDAKGLSDLVAKIQKTLQVSELELAEWKVTVALPDEQFNRFSEASNAIQPSFGQQPYFRSGFDVSHDAIPYKAPSDALADVMNQAFINDPTRAMRTIIALQEAATVMALTDEQLPGGFSYLFRHGAVAATLRIPNCEREVTPQELVEHHVYWTVLLAVQAHAAQSNFNGLRLMNEEQIKTILAYISSTEKRETLIRLL